MTCGIPVDCRVRSRKKQMRHRSLDSGFWLDVHSHDAVIWRTEKKFLAVCAPAGLAAAILGDLDLLLSARKGDQEDLKHSCGFVGGVSKPFPVIGKLRFILV